MLSSTEGSTLPSLVVHVQRDKARALVRAAFSRRRWRIISTRTPEELEGVFRRTLVDAAIIDLGAPDEAAWKAAAFAAEFPSTPFFAILPLRASDTPAAARCTGLGFVDLIVEGIDENAARDLVHPHAFSTRFRQALGDPPPTLGLTTPLQRAAWDVIVAHSGRPVTTKELAKNPGHDIRDIARILDFASSSHLAVTAQRIFGTRPASLARLRTTDLIDRFAQGRTRSRS